MQYCKPVDLRVSLDATEEETTTQADQPAGAGAATPSTVVTTELGMSSRDSRSEPQPLAKSRILSEGDAVQTDPHNGMASNSGGARDVDAGGSGRLCEDGAEKPKEESSVGYKTQSAGSSRMTGDTGAAASPGKDGRRTPWILDICLVRNEGAVCVGCRHMAIVGVLASCCVLSVYAYCGLCTRSRSPPQ